MRGSMTRAMALAACAILGLCLGAQSSGQVLRADIPFAFHVRDTVMPAGDYEIRVDPAKRAVTVSAMSGLVTAQFFALTANQTGRSENYLVFHRFGNSYFLDRVKTNMVPFALEAPGTRREREAEKMARAFANAEVAETRVPIRSVAR